MPTDRRHLIIGAGYSGIGVAKAFKDAEIPYDQVERNAEIGGNWLDGVYDSTHIISSRDSTGYADFPMPESYPDFPSKAQMLAYLRSYVDHFGLRDRIEFETEVVRAEPLAPRNCPVNFLYMGLFLRFKKCRSEFLNLRNNPM